MLMQNNGLILTTPLEQFEILRGCKYTLLNNFVLAIFFSGLLLSLFFGLRLQIFIFFQDRVVFFFKNVFKTIIDLKSQEFFVFFFFIFVIILINNLVGVLPYTYTLTSSFLLTSFFSFIVFFGILYINIEKNKLNFLNLFVPQGVPQVILPFLVIIEMISNLMRVISLSVRLFANMVAGHALIKILISFGVVILGIGNIFSVLGLLFWVLITMIGMLEVMIAFLQAYVFAFLSLVYLSEVL